MNSVKSSLRTAWVLALLLLAVPLQAGEQVVALVVVASGEVEAKGPDGARALSRRSEVYLGESVVTGADSRAQLRFTDGAMVSLDAGSELEIETYEQRDAEDKGEDRALLRLVEGGLRTLSGSIGERSPETYELDTPLGSIGIRGTDYQAAVGGGELAVAVWDGRIRVRNEAGELPLGDDQPFRFAVVRAIDDMPRGRLEMPPALQFRTDAEAETAVGAVPVDDEQDLMANAEAETSGETVSARVLEESAQQAGPSLPDWFPEAGELTQRSFLLATFDFEDAQGGFSAPTGSNRPNGGTAFDLWAGGGTDFPVMGFLFDGLDPVNDGTKVPNYPVHWGQWDGRSEVLVYQPAEELEFDERGELQSDIEFEVVEFSEVFGSAAWMYLSDDPLTHSQLQDVRTGAVLTFSTSGEGSFLAATAANGELNAAQSMMEFQLDVETGAINAGQLELLVEGDTDQMLSAGFTGELGGVDVGTLFMRLDDGAVITIDGQEDFAAEGNFFGNIVAHEDGIQSSPLATAGGWSINIVDEQQFEHWASVLLYLEEQF